MNESSYSQIADSSIQLVTIALLVKKRNEEACTYCLKYTFSSFEERELLAVLKLSEDEGLGDGKRDAIVSHDPGWLRLSSLVVTCNRTEFKRE